MRRRPSVHRDSSGERRARAGDQAIAALAARQYGIVSRSQLRALGETDDEIDYRLATKRLLPLWRGVYVVGQARVSPEGCWLAAVLASGSGAVLSHRSAARLWGLLSWNGRIEVTVPSWRRPQAGIAARESVARADDLTTHRGIPVTTVARTLLDLGAVDAARVPKAFEQADALGLLDVRELQQLLERNPRRPGSAAIRSVLREAVQWRGISRSELEALFRTLVHDAASHRPRPTAGSTSGRR